MRKEFAQTFDEYVTGEWWKSANLSHCPVCRGPVLSGGTYQRKAPQPAKVARFYCARCHLTIGVLPDSYASRLPGLLREIEAAVTVAEGASSIEEAAQKTRDAKEDGAITLGGAVKWLRRRLQAVREVLTAVVGLYPDRFAECAPTIASFRERLGKTDVLVALRALCAERLGALASPLGFRPRQAREGFHKRTQQSMGRDPPVA